MSELNPTYASPTTASTKKEPKNSIPTQSINQPSKEEILFFIRKAYAGFCASGYKKQIPLMQQAEMSETYSKLLLFYNK